MIQSQIDSNLKQPRTKSAGWIEQLKPTVNAQKDILGEILNRVLIHNEPRNDTHQAAFVPMHEFAERVLIAISGKFDEPGVAEPLEIALVGSRINRRDPIRFAGCDCCCG